MLGRHRRGLVVLVLMVAGCTSVNRPLNAPDVLSEDRQPNRTRSSLGVAAADADGRFVGIALSGGGSRSANFSAACLFQLQRLGLLRHVDYLSSVSGGSLTAAYYCAGQPWDPQSVQRKLTHSFATDVWLGTIQPWNMVALTLSDWDRSDLLAGSFERNLFRREGRGLTFADLRDDRPRLLINATDLQSGRRFVFCNESLDELNTDLSSYPLAYAVAASAAVPVLMHEVTLRDYSTTFKQYRHLVDGGVADNLGIQTLVEAYEKRMTAARQQGLPDPYPRGAVLLVIDARTGFDAVLSDRGDIGLIEGLRMSAGLSSTILLNRASSATLAELIVHSSPDDASARKLRAHLRQLEQFGHLQMDDRFGHTVQVVHLALSRVEGLSNLPFASFHQRVNNIATYFDIGSDEAHYLYQAAELLVREKFESHLLDLVKELETTSSPATTRPS